MSSVVFMSVNIPVFLENNVEKKMNFIFGVITLLLIILLLFFARYIHQAETIIENDRVSYVHLDYTDKLTINLLNLEMLTQRYLLTKNDNVLQELKNSFVEIKSVMKMLESRWSEYINISEIKLLEYDVDLIIMHLTETSHQENAGNQLQNLQHVQVRIAEIKQKIDAIQKRIYQVVQVTHQANANTFDFLRWVMAGLAIISFALLFMTFRQARQQQQLVKRYTQEMLFRNNNLEDTINKRTEELIDLASHITLNNEHEKKRIARELHDELGALLTAARLDASWIKRILKSTDDLPMKTRLDRLLENIDKGIHVKREITHSLIPPLLHELGLLEAITAMTQDVPDENPPHYHLELTTELPTISSDLELALYRICQESLTNIRKYAQARNVTIRLRLKDNNIELYIIDDGEGFDESILKKGTYGITGMRARAAMFGGVMTVSSPKNESTTVKVVLPLDAEV